MRRPTALQNAAAAVVDYCSSDRTRIAGMQSQSRPEGQLLISVDFLLSPEEAAGLRAAMRSRNAAEVPEQGKLLPDPEDYAPRMLTPRERVFAYGVPLLAAAGCKEATARSMLAGLCRDHGEQAVAEAVDETARSGAIQPTSYLQALLRGKRGRRNQQERLEDENAAVAARFLAAGGTP